MILTLYRYIVGQSHPNMARGSESSSKGYTSSYTAEQFRMYEQRREQQPDVNTHTARAASLLNRRLPSGNENITPLDSVSNGRVPSPQIRVTPLERAAAALNLPDDLGEWEFLPMLVLILWTSRTFPS